MFFPKYEGLSALRSFDDLGKKTLDLQVNKLKSRQETKYKVHIAKYTQSTIIDFNDGRVKTQILKFTSGSYIKLCSFRSMKYFLII